MSFSQPYPMGMEMGNTFNFKGNLMALLIIALPFILYLHLLIDGSTNTFYFFGFEIKNWTSTNETFIWIILNDLVPMILLILMFFSTPFQFRIWLLPLIVVYFLSILFYLNIFSNFLEAFLSVKAFLLAISCVGIIMLIDQRFNKYHSNSQMYVRLYEFLSLAKEINIGSLKEKIKHQQLRSQNHDSKVNIKNLFHWKNLMENDIRRFRYNQKIARGSQTLNSLNVWLVLFLLTLLMIWFIHRIIPSGLMSYEIFGYTIDNNEFDDLRTFIWFVSRKFIVIGLLAIWFSTSKSWWRYAILSPLIIYSYQFWEAFQDVKELDAGGNLRVLPLVLLNVVLVILISRVVKYRAQFIAVYEEISREVDEILDEMKSKYPQEVGATLERIRKGKKGKEYRRQQLKALEEEIEARLDLTKG